MQWARDMRRRLQGKTFNQQNPFIDNRFYRLLVSRYVFDLESCTVYRIDMCTQIKGDLSKKIWKIGQLNCAGSRLNALA